MAEIVLIIGRSGSGKSTSLRNFQVGEVAIISVLGKRLPFKTSLRTFNTSNYEKVKLAMSKAVEKGIKSIVIDDAGYLVTTEWMSKSREAGYEKYNVLANNYYNLITHSQSLPDGVIVYIVMHEEQNEFGGVKPKTIGKMLDQQVCLEGFFTIVLRAVKEDGKYLFRTQTDGQDVTKSPMGMFATGSIDNDLKKVDDVIREHYGWKVESVGKEGKPDEQNQ